MKHRWIGSCLLGTLVVGSGSSAFAAITHVTDSRVQGFFSTQNGGFFLSDPLGQPGVVPPPVGAAAIAGANGAQWVPFTFPGSRVYNGIDNAAVGARTSTFTAITGGFFVANAARVSSTFIAVPQTSFLVQEAGAVGVAFTQLNFSIDYNVNAAGVLGANQTARYRAFGNVLAGGFARYQAQFTYWDVGANVQLGQLSLDTGNINAAGAFNRNLVDNQFVNGMAGAGTLRINGFMKWEGDPMEIHVDSDPVPEPATLAAFGLGLVALLRRRLSTVR